MLNYDMPNELYQILTDIVIDDENIEIVKASNLSKEGTYFYIVSVDEETATYLKLIHGSDNVWKR